MSGWSSRDRALVVAGGVAVAAIAVVLALWSTLGGDSGELPADVAGVEESADEVSPADTDPTTDDDSVVAIEDTPIEANLPDVGEGFPVASTVFELDATVGDVVWVPAGAPDTSPIVNYQTDPVDIAKTVTDQAKLQEASNPEVGIFDVIEGMPEGEGAMGVEMLAPGRVSLTIDYTGLDGQEQRSTIDVTVTE